MDEGPRPLDAVLREAAEKIDRLAPADALEAADAGALIVDIRSDAARAETGIVPDSIHIPRTVLEWRLEPGGEWQNPYVGGIERQVVLLCDHGYSSVLAAASLVELGYARAGDVVGGFQAWREAGLPTIPAPPRDGSGVLPGMNGPD